MDRLPEFPESKKLDLDDRAIVEVYVRRFPPYSDYHFTALYCYNVNDRVEVSRYNGNLVVLMQDCITEELHYSFIGDYRTAETAHALLLHAGKRGIKEELRYVPGCAAEGLISASGLLVKEDTDNFDYIISADVLHAMQGRLFCEKRKLVNRFMRNYPSCSTVVLDLHDARTIEQMIALFNLWAEGKQLSAGRVDHERRAFDRLIMNIQRFDLCGLGICIDGRLAAFLIFEFIGNGYAISHFGKYDVSAGGVFFYLLKETAGFLKEKGYLFLNIEQDLGIAGLRQLKRQLRPVSYLRKYIVTVK